MAQSQALSNSPFHDDGQDMLMQTQSYFLIAVLLLSTRAVLATEGSTTRPIEPNERVQRILENSRFKQPVTSANWMRGAADIRDLMEPNQGRALDRDEVVRQLALFFMRHHDADSDAYFIGSMRSWLQLATHETMAALDPYLETTDKSLRGANCIARSGGT